MVLLRSIGGVVVRTIIEVVGLTFALVGLGGYSYLDLWLNHFISDAHYGLTQRCITLGV